MLSPHLVYKASYIADNISGAKTTLTMNQLYHSGNCYVIQLKNGHYIVNDGGYPQDMEPLIQSLKENVPNGEKPVIEAWFFSHDHYDHVGVLQNSEAVADQVIVEGIYSNKVSEEVATLLGFEGNYNYGLPQLAATYFRNAAGEQTPVYRMHAGERYYFNDITVEVPHTCEQMVLDEYSDDLNTSCTWLMYYIEGQKFLLSADAEIENMRFAAGCFSQEYFDVDIMNVPHHGYNMYIDDLGYYRSETLLYSVNVMFSAWLAETQQDNLNMIDTAKEFMCYAEGGKKLTFPYTVGSYETIEPWYPQYTITWSEGQNAQLEKFGLNP